MLSTGRIRRMFRMNSLMGPRLPSRPPYEVRLYFSREPCGHASIHCDRPHHQTIQVQDRDKDRARGRLVMIFAFCRRGPTLSID